MTLKDQMVCWPIEALRDQLLVLSKVDIDDDVNCPLHQIMAAALKEMTRRLDEEIAGP